jgi:hypothetical protein
MSLMRSFGVEGLFPGRLFQGDPQRFAGPALKKSDLFIVPATLYNL